MGGKRIEGYRSTYRGNISRCFESRLSNRRKRLWYICRVSGVWERLNRSVTVRTVLLFYRRTMKKSHCYHSRIRWGWRGRERKRRECFYLTRFLAPLFRRYKSHRVFTRSDRLSSSVTRTYQYSLHIHRSRIASQSFGYVTRNRTQNASIRFVSYTRSIARRAYVHLRFTWIIRKLISEAASAATATASITVARECIQLSTKLITTERRREKE